MNRAVILLSMLVDLGCSYPRVPIRCRSDSSLRELVAAADTILIGTVTTAEVVGPDVTINCPYSMRVRLRRVVIQIENVLKGVGVSEFFRYDCVSDCGGVTGASSLERGAREAVFLINQNGSYRAVRDVSAAELPIFSGPHQKLKGTTVEEKLAHALLVPGTSFDPAEFADRLPVSKHRASELAGRYEALLLTVPLLRQPGLGPASCLELADFRFDYDGCLTRLHSSSTDPSVKRVAAERLRGLAEEDKLLRRFVTNPEAYLAWAAMGGSVERQDVLSILAHHPDPTVSAVACRELGSSMTGAAASICAEKMHAR